MYKIPLPKYRLTLDTRHLDGLVDIVPVEKEGFQQYELPRLGTYGAAVVIETALRPDKYDLINFQVITGRKPEAISHDGLVGYALSLDSSGYFFFGRITLFLACDTESPVKVRLLSQDESDGVRQAWFLSHAERVLRTVKKRPPTQRLVKFGHYVISSLRYEYPSMDEATKKRLGQLHKTFWPELIDLFKSYEKGPHVDLLWLLNEDKLVIWR